MPPAIVCVEGMMSTLNEVAQILSGICGEDCEPYGCDDCEAMKETAQKIEAKFQAHFRALVQGVEMSDDDVSKALQAWIDAGQAQRCVTNAYVWVARKQSAAILEGIDSTAEYVRVPDVEEIKAKLPDVRTFMYRTNEITADAQRRRCAQAIHAMLKGEA